MNDCKCLPRAAVASHNALRPHDFYVRLAQVVQREADVTGKSWRRRTTGRVPDLLHSYDGLMAQTP